MPNGCVVKSKLFGLSGSPGRLQRKRSVTHCVTLPVFIQSGTALPETLVLRPRLALVRLLMLPHLLLLLIMALRHLLRLLLMLAFQLLHAILAGLLLGVSLVFLLLALLELLALLLLPGIELVLLLLKSFVVFRIARAGADHARSRGKVLGVNGGPRKPPGVFRARRIVVAGFSRLHHPGFGKRSRARSSCDRRAAVIDGRPQLLVLSRSLHVLHLRSYGGNVAVVHRGFFFRCRARLNASLAAVVADAGVSIIVHDGRVIDVVNLGHVDVVDLAVVEETAVIPSSAFITVAEISVTVVDAPIETHARTPISRMKDKAAATPTPPGRRPEEARLRRQHPGSRHPVIIVAIPGPITGCPDVAVTRTERLFVNR